MQGRACREMRAVDKDLILESLVCHAKELELHSEKGRCGTNRAQEWR